MHISPWLVLLAVLGLSDVAHAGPLDNYLTRCEVRQLASFRGIGVGKAKRQLKKEIKQGDKTFYGQIDKARGEAARCRFSDTGLTTQDAGVLASFWGTDVDGAMALVETKYGIGMGEQVWWALDDAKWKTKGDAYYDEGYEGYEYDPPIDEISKFWSSNYHYCDARMLSELWGIDPYDAKLTIGRKVGYGDLSTLSYLDSELGRARSAAMSMGRVCAFHELSYSYDDVYALARFWGTDDGTAKMRMADMVSRGQDKDVRQQLAIARSR